MGTAAPRLKSSNFATFHSVVADRRATDFGETKKVCEMLEYVPGRAPFSQLNKGVKDAVATSTVVSKKNRIWSTLELSMYVVIS